jgi:DNA-binding transcriptional regulator YhcF (GntR family)
MKLLFSINPAEGLPVYRQLVEQIKHAIAAGTLRPGDQLPTHRDLSAELVIAPMTVKKAYDLLVQEGLIVMGSGRGTFVSESTGQVSATAKRERLTGKIRQLLVEASILEIPLSDVQRLIGQEYDKMSADSSAKRKTTPDQRR